MILLISALKKSKENSKIKLKYHSWYELSNGYKLEQKFFGLIYIKT